MYKYYVKTEKCNIIIIDNNSKVRQEIFRINRSINNAKSIASFDFDTLYTNIPHDKLKYVLAEVIKSSFISAKKRFIRCTLNNAYFSDSARPYKGTHILEVEDLIELTNYFIDNSFIAFKGKVFKQCIGIPMGIDPAPFMANLFLFYYEHKYMHKLLSSTESCKARKLSRSFRYLDDLLSLNDSGNFIESIIDMYPNELKLSCTDVNTIQADYLDLDIFITDNYFGIKLFDKRDNFNFVPINYPCLTYSNVSSASSYGIYLSQLLRICRICTHINDFEMAINKLTQSFSNKGYQLPLLRRHFDKFIDNYPNEWAKFGCLVALPNLLT